MDSLCDDPRPELREDSKLWKELLGRARELHGDYLASMLRVMRQCRARIRWKASGKLWLGWEADTDPVTLLRERPDTALIGYQRAEEWEADKSEHLAPYSGQIAGLLRELGSVR